MQAIIPFTIPILLTNIFQQLYSVVDGIVEVTVNRLRLDCREKDRRFAEVSVSLTLLGASREIVGRATGVGVADAADGRYTAAFSSAFDAAMAEALAAL